MNDLGKVKGMQYCDLCVFSFPFVYVSKANCFSKLAKPPTICKIVGKSVLDGLGLPTLQVEIFCTVQNFPKV